MGKEVGRTGLAVRGHVNPLVVFGVALLFHCPSISTTLFPCIGGGESSIQAADTENILPRHCRSCILVGVAIAGLAAKRIEGANAQRIARAKQVFVAMASFVIGSVLLESSRELGGVDVEAASQSA